MRQSLVISCILHLLLLLVLVGFFLFKQNLQIGERAPMPIAVSFVLSTPVALPMVAPVPSPIVKPLKAITKANKVEKKLKQLKVLEPIKKQLVPKKKLAPKPAKQIVTAKPIVTPAKKIHNKVNVSSVQNDAKLGQVFAKQIGSCVQSKFNLVALGHSKNNNEPQLKIKAAFKLQKNGMLQSEPVIQVSGGDAHQRDIAYAQALSALKACSPFSLPIDKYYLWSDISMIFDPYRNLN